MNHHRISIAPLVVLRWIVGTTFWFWASSYLQGNRWSAAFVEPAMLFKYAGFRWVEPWPGDGMWWHFQFARFAALCFAVGFATRFSALMLSCTMTYVMLVERQIYNNHDYLLATTALLCAILPCGRVGSVDQWVRVRLGFPPHQPSMLRWQWWLVRFQLGMPYVFGGIAKLDSDWLRGQPARMFVDARIETPFIGSLFSWQYSPFVMAWGGMVFDLLIVPALMWNKTRVPAVACALAFHLTNATIFRIGVFPWFMIATLFVFFPHAFVPKVLARLGFSSCEPPPDHVVPKRESLILRIGKALAISYVTIQLLLPIRPWVLPGNPSWNERGQRFAWRMMLRHKDCLLWFKIETKQDYLFAPGEVILTQDQVRRATRDPELIRQAAVGLARRCEALGYSDCRVHAFALVSLNGRVPTTLVDPSVDLTMAQRGWFSDSWVHQDPGPFLETAWRAPFDEWWEVAGVPDNFAPLRGMRPSEAMRQYEAAAGVRREVGGE